MAGETTMTVIGNLTADPELRVTAGGLSVLSCTLASTPRSYERDSGQWKDGATLYQRLVVYGAQAEHAAESFRRGSRLIAHGKLTQLEYEAREGGKRTVVELVVDEIGASARYTTLAINKAVRRSEHADQGEDTRATPWDENASVPAEAR